MDIQTAFPQESGFERFLYFRPPEEEEDPSGSWYFLASAYKLVDSGRLWYRTSERPRSFRLIWTDQITLWAYTLL